MIRLFHFTLFQRFENRCRSQCRVRHQGRGFPLFFGAPAPVFKVYLARGVSGTALCCRSGGRAIARGGFPTGGGVLLVVGGFLAGLAGRVNHKVAVLIVPAFLGSAFHVALENALADGTDLRFGSGSCRTGDMLVLVEDRAALAFLPVAVLVVEPLVGFGAVTLFVDHHAALTFVPVLTAAAIQLVRCGRVSLYADVSAALTFLPMMLVIVEQLFIFRNILQEC